MTLELKAGGGPLRVKARDRGEVEAQVAEINVVDRDGDVLLPGSIRTGTRVKVSFYGHDAVLHDAAPVAMGQLHVDGRRVTMTAKYFMTTTRGVEAFRMVKEIGSDGEWSVAFQTRRTADMTPAWRSSGAVRLLSSVDVIEASPVLRGAALQSGTLATKRAATGLTREELTKEVARFRRNESLVACLKERHGSTAWNTAECAARWLSDGRLQQGPLIKWFDPDGRRMGFYNPLRPDEISISRDLTEKETVITVAEETAHWFRPWEPSELLAKTDAEWIARRYLETHHLGAA